MKRPDIEKISERVLDWCIGRYGYSKYYKHCPLIEIQYKSDKPICYGEFDTIENMIYLYSNKSRTIKQVVNTMIHEYQHYLQSPTWIQRHMKKYGGGSNNPYESYAERIAHRDSDRCIKELKLK